jgi:hypothetical protein
MIQFSVDLKSTDRGLDALKARLKSHQRVHVGFQGEASYTKAIDTDGKPGPATVVDIATWHEFGTPKIPMRSMLRRAVVLNEPKIQGWLKLGAERVIEGKGTTETTLGQIGLKIVDLVQARIESGEITPPLADSTIERRRKHTDTPLLDTGQLKNSITSKVVKE